MHADACWRIRHMFPLPRPRSQCTECAGGTRSVQLTVDRFTDEGAWRAFLTEHRDAYARLDAATKGLTTGECEIAGGEVG